MTDAFSFIAVVLVAAAVAVLPGAAALAGLRVRGLTLWALAPVASTAFLAVIAVAFGFVRIEWAPVPVIVALLIIVAAAWVLGRFLGPRRSAADVTGRFGRGVLLTGLILGAIFITIRLVIYIPTPDAISQTNDAVFHLNALQWILDTGSASSWHVNGVVGGRGFYPSAWHALSSLTLLLTGASAPVAANAVTLVTATVVWPMGIVWFSRSATGSEAIAGIAGALSPLLFAFPMLMVQWGIVYPYLLSVALIPAAAATVISLTRWREGEDIDAAGSGVVVAWILLSVMGAVALALAQPSSLLAWAILIVAWSTFLLVRNIVSLSARARVTRIVSAAGILLAFAAVWYLLSFATSGSHWPAFRSATEAVADVLLISPVYLPPAIVVSAFTLVGIGVALRSVTMRWLVVAWVAFALLYVTAATVDNDLARRVVLGGWYADPYRIAAIAPIAILPLAAVGLRQILLWIMRMRRPVPSPGGADALPVAALGIAGALASVSLVVTPVVPFVGITDGQVVSASTFTIGDDTYLSTDERRLLERLTDQVPAGARVIGNPSTGTGFGYALSGIDVFPRTWAHPRTPAWETIMHGLRNAASDPAVCDALAVYGDPQYVLDFGPGQEQPGRYVLPEMSDFGGKPGFELVDTEGAASLWRITACDP